MSARLTSLLRKFTCAGFGSRYVGETNRHFYTRVIEHLFVDKSSNSLSGVESSTRTSKENETQRSTPQVK